MTTVDARAIAAESFAGMEQAWNQADGVAFGREFTDDTDFTGHPRRSSQGQGRRRPRSPGAVRLDLRREHRALRGRVGPGGRARCVVAFAASTMVAPIGPLQGTNHATMTAVITEQEGRWTIAAFQNTLKPGNAS